MINNKCFRKILSIFLIILSINVLSCGDSSKRGSSNTQDNSSNHSNNGNNDDDFKREYLDKAIKENVLSCLKHIEYNTNIVAQEMMTQEELDILKKKLDTLSDLELTDYFYNVSKRCSLKEQEFNYLLKII